MNEIEQKIQKEQIWALLDIAYKAVHASINLRMLLDNKPGDEYKRLVELGYKIHEEMERYE